MRRFVFVVVLVFLLCCSAAAFATDWFVATNGNDSTGDGSIGNPFASLQGAIFYHAQPGDTVQVRAGTYTALNNVNGDGYCAIQKPDHALLGGSPGSPITIRPYDGDFTVFYTGGVRFVRCKYLTITGMDMSLPAGGHPFSVTSGCDDYATVDKRSNNIVATNCKIHDGGTSSGQLKIQQSDYVTVENCEMYNLGAGGAVIDCVWVEHVKARHNYLHDAYSSAGFFKGGSLYSTFESSVATAPQGSGTYSYGFMPGGQTDPQFCNPDPTVTYESMYTVIRNNIVTGQTRGATPTVESGYCYVYNNLMKDCATLYPQYYSYITVILTGGSRFDGYTRHLFVFNNIFYDSDGNMRPYGSVLSGGGSGSYEDWQTGYNNFYNNGQPLVHESDTPDPTTETGATYGDPNLTMSGSPTTWQGWVNYYRPLWNSQSNAMLKDKGTSAAGGAPCPAVVRDVEGNPRPRDTGWDIGPYEYQGTVVAPTADFWANAQGQFGIQLWATPPATFDFTDCSSGGPTSWSWSFGDTSTSTVQNPSHTYSSFGQYTVALTATNSAGNDTETKTNYLTVKALQAGFTYTPAFGAVPLAVTFTDTSSNSPTSWSWTFGDGGTSTAQNPTHTYNSASYYTVALTAANANGNDTCTKPNCIAACTEVIVYPTSYTMDVPTGGTQHLVSGTLADLQTADGTCMVFAGDDRTSDGRYICEMAFVSASGYTQDQIVGGTMDYRATTNHTDTCCRPSWNCPACPIHPMPMTLTTWSWTKDATHTLDTNGDARGTACQSPQSNKVPINVSVDMVRWHLYLKPSGGQPPVANFTGNPTSGPAPLAVNFTDTSTNTPTSWSWTFGDTSTSTVQNPSHTYAAGTYTVTLTATNAYGSDGETKTDYITATVTSPTFVAAGSVASGTGAITPALPAGLQSNDILLLFLETANQAISISNQNGGTWTQVTGSPQGYGTAGASNATRLTVFWSRYNGTQGAPTTSDSGNHQAGRIIAIRGATTSGDPCNVTAGGTESTVDNSGAIPGATTTVANTLVVAAIATSLPDTNGTANFSAWANADLTSVTERTDNTRNAGNGGGLATATGVKATAGAYTTTSVTCGTASTKAMMSIAIKP